MSEKWETDYERQNFLTLAGLTDCMVEKVSSQESSILSENLTPKFESISEKNSQDPFIVQLRMQLSNLSQNYTKLNEKYQRCQQELEEKKQKVVTLEEKLKGLRTILETNEEEK
jgi:predicted RNase H-like nuclease (RuvC/YqgF family)